MMVSVHALFSTSSKVGARIIAEGTAHLAPQCPKVSHTALLVQERWVHEATGTGVHVSSYDNWSKLHTEKARVSMAPREYQEIADNFRAIQGKKYDYMGVFYLSWRIFLNFFGATIPAKNAWESRNKYFCCEVIAKLTGKYYGMKSPVQILQELRSQNGRF